MSKRLKFFLSHLSISFLIALLVVGIVFFLWYPSPLAKAVGVTHIFLMLIAIDVVVGPILGFIVYKEGKKSLKFDLAVVILLQLSALSFGVYSIAQGRPVWVSYVVDRFELVRNNDLINDKADQALPQFQNPSWLQPQYVAVEFAQDKQIRNDDIFAEVLGGISVAQKPERYVPLDRVKNQIQKRAQSLETLNKFNDKMLVQKTLSQYPQANAFVPLKANAVDMTVLIDREKGEVVKIVDLRPW
ncbi:TfpX/TfpZ family type IV pilin accessory protein [Acinetobacter junii]|uniref:TfpX/TfpZ family type IV pilin accessory protein n=1 Tax=Acinetobacter junii TaxID=40215 RepID=UPI000F679A71|nr:TfpX/TfpZ family type IV pilin accessory protein [Acinetobacter junii]MDH1006386.1 type IV pilin accessory protein [Acinetobacter junii]QXR27490.1 type IV pilin accessory protein [Acinetobacter junii]